MKYTAEQLKEKMDNLPESIKKVMGSIETSNTIKRICHEKKLHIDQMGVLSEEIGLVMIGITRPGDFVYNITKRLSISSDLAREITKEVNDEIFTKIKEELQKIRGFEVEEKENKETEAEPSQSAETEKMPSEEPPTEPNQSPPPAPDMFKEKMSGIFQSKTEEETEENENKTNKSDQTPPRHDPYREPPE